MIKCTLKETLNRYNISPNQLSRESMIRPNTIYDIVNGSAVSITFSTLSKIIATLKRLTNENINVNEVFTFEDLRRYS